MAHKGRGNGVIEQLEALRKEYERQIPEKIAEIESLWLKALSGSCIENTLQTLYLKLHTLEGSAATYGLSNMSQAARLLGVVIKRIQESGAGPPPEQVVHFSEALKELRRCSVDMEKSHISCEEAFPMSESFYLDSSPAQADQGNRLIFLAEDDAQTALDLAVKLSCYGYEVRVFTQLEDLVEAIPRATPAAIVMDVIFPEGDLAGIKAITDIQITYGINIPTVFISANMNFSTRLSAIRAGARAVLSKPIHISLLADKLDALLNRSQPEPYRILIVDDDGSQADYHAAILDSAGMVCRKVTDPLQVLDSLLEFNPDLILTDLHMPGCSGLELASVIRQDEAFVSIPIVFLSVESNTAKHLAALCMGGDDFISKPVKPDHLTSSVMARAERCRILRTFMVRDSMTGLYNHTRIKEQLEIECSRAQRSRSPLSLALLDLDLFKSVNDTYGHQAGDQVLKSLSRLLRRRLRRSDFIGRYGGEEFAVILPDTRGEDAASVMEGIRSQFASIWHQHFEWKYTVTFSCGVADSPPHTNPRALTDAADKALYRAKSQGRNRVVSAE